jgi:hypothetical protein
MNTWLAILKEAIGSPFVEAPYAHRREVFFSWRDYLLACNNRMPLTYLSKVRSDSQLYLLLYNYHQERFHRIIEVIREVSEVFEQSGIEYAVIKTLRPYPEDTADIDVLIFDGEEEYHKSIRILSRIFRPIDVSNRKSEAGLYDYKPFKVSPYVCFWYRDNIKLDIHKELAVLNLIYVDKNDLRSYIRKAKLPNDGETKVLAPAAELLINVAHSVIKENSFSLADYLTTLHHLAKLSDPDEHVLLSLIAINKLKTAFRWYMGLIATIHFIAHGFVPEILKNILKKLNGSFVTPGDFITIARQEPPYRLKKDVLIRTYGEKLHHDLFRRNIPITILNAIREGETIKAIFERLFNI